MRLHHLALRVGDLERARAFYGDLLGLPERRRFEQEGRLRSIWLEAAGVMIMLEAQLRGPGAEEGSAHLLALAVDDLVGWEAKLAAAGIVLADRTDHTLYFHDPDGHRVGLSDFAFPRD